MTDTACALYRFYDHAGVLLYIGITANVGSRFKQHGREKPWWADVHSITLEHYDSREAVLEAERAAIVAEQPRYNVVYNRGHATGAPAVVQPRELTRQERLQRMTPDEFADYMLDKHPRVHGPWPKPQPKPCWVCGSDLRQPVNVIRHKGRMYTAHRVCRDQWHADHPADAPDTAKAFRDERREAILRGEIL